MEYEKYTNEYEFGGLNDNKKITTVFDRYQTTEIGGELYIEPIFEAGNVFVYQGEFLLDWLKEAKEFPSGKHDDQMDNLSAGYIITKQQQGQIITGGVSGL